MNTESIGLTNGLSDSGCEDATSFEGTGETAPSTDDASQQPGTSPAEEDGASNLEVNTPPSNTEERREQVLARIDMEKFTLIISRVNLGGGC
jgi:hypothetical protein